jgi:hypothetical protein
MNVMEIYVDSTHKTNINKAELFAIIGEEDGVGIPLGYMLMEKKPAEDSRLYPLEVMNCCQSFFTYSHDLGLNPTFLHTDKCTSEIGALQVHPNPERGVVYSSTLTSETMQLFEH